VTELWSVPEIARRFAASEPRVRELLSRAGTPRPVVVAGRERYRRADVETWAGRLPSIFGHGTVTGTKTGPMAQDHEAE